MVDKEEERFVYRSLSLFSCREFASDPDTAPIIGKKRHSRSHQCLANGHYALVSRLSTPFKAARHGRMSLVRLDPLNGGYAHFGLLRQLCNRPTKEGPGHANLSPRYLYFHQCPGVHQ
jgi:hypothetical protein